MSVLRKLFYPTSAWEPVAAELGGKFVPGNFFKRAQIILRDGPHQLAVKAELGKGDSRITYTKVIVESPLNPDVHLGLVRKTPGQGLMRRLASMAGFGVDLPGLGDDSLVMTRDAQLAERVFLRGTFLDALGRAPESIAVQVGGDLTKMDEADSEISVSKQGVITDRGELAAMVALIRALLDSLQEAGCLEAGGRAP